MKCKIEECGISYSPDAMVCTTPKERRYKHNREKIPSEQFNMSLREMRDVGIRGKCVVCTMVSFINGFFGYTIAHPDPKHKPYKEEKIE